MRSALPPPAEQAERLIALGVHELAGVPAHDLRAAGSRDVDGALLVVRGVPTSALAPLLTHGGKPGFIVVDLTDVDSFAPIEDVAVPDSPLYLVSGIERGDGMANWSPDEALPAILAGGRSPLTLVEGMHWLLQQQDALERKHCFMTIGTRLRRSDGRIDARTPAIWISNGTGRDGRDNRNAPKVGWCWAGNRHSWLGFASAASRTPVA